jgi:hypothetical protein
MDQLNQDNEPLLGESAIVISKWDAAMRGFDKTTKIATIHTLCKIWKIPKSIAIVASTLMFLISRVMIWILFDFKTLLTFMGFKPNSDSYSNLNITFKVAIVIGFVACEFISNMGAALSEMEDTERFHQEIAAARQERFEARQERQAAQQERQAAQQERQAAEQFRNTAMATFRDTRREHNAARQDRRMALAARRETGRFQRRTRTDFDLAQEERGAARQINEQTINLTSRVLIGQQAMYEKIRRIHDLASGLAINQALMDAINDLNETAWSEDQIKQMEIDGDILFQRMANAQSTSG